MTICITARYGNKAYMASDGLIVASDRKIRNLKNCTKILKFKHCLVSYAGGCSMFTILQELSQDETFCKRKFMKMKDLKDMSRFAKEVYTRLKDNVECNPYYDEDDDSSSQMLVLTKDSIYSCSSYMDVLEHNNYEAIGSGEDLAMGALAVLFDQITNEEDLKPLIERTIKIVCELSNGCGLPMFIYEIED